MANDIALKILNFGLKILNFVLNILIGRPRVRQMRILTCGLRAGPPGAS